MTRFWWLKLIERYLPAFVVFTWPLCFKTLNLFISCWDWKQMGFSCDIFNSRALILSCKADVEDSAAMGVVSSERISGKVTLSTLSTLKGSEITTLLNSILDLNSFSRFSMIILRSLFTSGVSLILFQVVEMSGSLRQFFIKTNISLFSRTHVRSCSLGSTDNVAVTK